ncbi:hypothetical protein Tco_0749863 [Tanacetum coccineum]|uniref:Uncharacterized protein n=1 Tax=Tanacetum coccineum TaxID=301880 RepID=A0ABQ4Z2Q2_9ASTR
MGGCGGDEGGSHGCGGDGGGGKWRVRESGSGDRVDPVTRSLFGLRRKMPAGKVFRRRRYSGRRWGGSRRRRRWRGRWERVVSPKPVLFSLQHAQLPVPGSTRMYRDLRLPTSGPK